MVLACSRHVFLRPVLRMDQAAWAQAHVEAFAFFGGVPAHPLPADQFTTWYLAPPHPLRPHNCGP
jgi:transposase